MEATSKSRMLIRMFEPWEVISMYWECLVEDLRGGHQVMRLMGTSRILLWTKE